MSHKLEIHEGAILIADAHCSEKYPQFLNFLKALESGEIRTPQLILMGDMFELLFGVISRTKEDNAEGIALLNRLSDEMEIIYFEGNHDFGLANIFPKIHIFPLRKQPVICRFYDQDIQLSHGDTKTPLGYQIYTKLIRNPFILSSIGWLDIVCRHCIIKWLKSRGVQKDPCYKISLFKEIIAKRLKYLEGRSPDVVIEGHFHQNQHFEIYDFEYINLASFACNHTYFIVQSINRQLVLQETRFKES